MKIAIVLLLSLAISGFAQQQSSNSKQNDDLQEILESVFEIPDSGQGNGQGTGQGTGQGIGQGTGQIGGQGTGQGAGQGTEQEFGQPIDGGGGDSFTGALPDSSCVCVPYYMCDPENNTIITDGSTDGYGEIDIRFGEKCEHYLDVCCKPGSERPVPPPPHTTVQTVVPKGPPPCGVRNSNGVSFHITGNTDGEAQFAEFPWMVAILHKSWTPSSDRPLSQCGGSLIHPRVVLTGAHCVDTFSPNELKIRAGEWDTQTTKEILPFQERNIQTIIKHEQFNAKTLYNDIALIVLESPVQYADNVATVCLPQKGTIFTQRNCVATGWGKKVFGQTGKYQVILKSIELPIMQRDVCQSNLRRTRLGPKFNLHQSFICAGGEKGKDTCTGDGGSPLVCPNARNRYEQAGIVAWGIGCGDAQVPGVYGRVELFKNWIDGHMQQLGYGTTTYTS